jgi:hypothetical protein
MLEMDLKAPATAASESFVAAASAAAGTVPALPFASLPALAGPSKTNLGDLSGNEFHKA